VNYTFEHRVPGLRMMTERGGLVPAYQSGSHDVVFTRHSYCSVMLKGRSDVSISGAVRWTIFSNFRER